MSGSNWFWADERPGGGYNEHYIGPAQTGYYNNVSFYWIPGTGNWKVMLNGSQIGTSVNNGAFSWGGEAGAESTTTNATIDGIVDNYQYTDPQNNWHGVNPNLQFYGSAGWLSGFADPGSLTGGFINVTSGCGNAVKAQMNADARYRGTPLTPQAAPSWCDTITTRVPLYPRRPACRTYCG